MKSTDVKEIYSKEYFLGAVDGYREFDEFDGTFDSLFDRYKRNVHALELKPLDKYLEVACGRGEIVLFHAKNGGKGLGVDYSEDAISLAMNKMNQLGLSCNFQVSSFADINIESQFDKILASEFIEHVSVDEGAIFFAKVFQLLRTGGRLVVFTHPNTLQRTYGYPLTRLYNLIFKRKLLPKIPDDMLGDHYKKFHLNEQSIITLRKSAELAGFKVKFIGYDNNDSDNLLHRLIDATPLRHILRTNLLLIAVK